MKNGIFTRFSKKHESDLSKYIYVIYTRNRLSFLLSKTVKCLYILIAVNPELDLLCSVHLFIFCNVSPIYIVYFATPCFDTFFWESKLTGLTCVSSPQLISTHFLSPKQKQTILKFKNGLKVCRLPMKNVYLDPNFKIFFTFIWLDFESEMGSAA